MLLRIVLAVLIVHGFVHLRVWWWGLGQADAFDPRRSG